MVLIKLTTGKSLNAIQGRIGLVPFKVWDKDGSRAALDKIMARTDAKRSYFVAGPKNLKGLMTKEERGWGAHSAGLRGGWHSALTRRKIANALKAQTKKQKKTCTVPLRGWRAHNASLRGGEATKKKYQGMKAETVSINMGHGRPSKLHVRIYSKEARGE